MTTTRSSESYFEQFRSLLEESTDDEIAGAPVKQPSMTFSGGILRIPIVFRVFQVEYSEDEAMRLELLEAGVDEEDAIRIVHVDFPALSWRRGVLRGASGATFYRSLDASRGLIGCPDATLAEAKFDGQDWIG